MARIREFNPDEALDKAMRVFWQKGYANTSIEDLVSATGVNRYGLYDEFENKHGLFLAALDHYQNAVAGALFEIVERPGASLTDIRTYFAKLVELSSSEMGKLGCLMANSASEVAPHDERAANMVEKFRTRCQHGFKNALSNAKVAGELPTRCDVEAIADFLTGVMQGLSVMARSRANSRMMVNVVEVALSHLQ
ncbi:MAG TPA: helix-turn-helix domain-containing protein [Novimethylophilus sp.]|jgi:TetR/AcrR family transcriptional repressor of nem operon|uniref:TetR/AcrR family transcriptional regulator n=1 Tax=Novimethylophilus sp. TaxID=2137426 RepID=UPI002F3FEAB6